LLQLSTDFGERSAERSRQSLSRVVLDLNRILPNDIVSTGNCGIPFFKNQASNFILCLPITGGSNFSFWKNPFKAQVDC
jgi:hypothetical protein